MRTGLRSLVKTKLKTAPELEKHLELWYNKDEIVRVPTYGNYKEHAHDFIWDENKIIDETSWKSTDKERGAWWYIMKPQHLRTEINSLAQGITFVYRDVQGFLRPSNGQNLFVATGDRPKNCAEPEGVVTALFRADKSANQFSRQLIPVY